MKKALKGCRPSDQINAEYSMLCGQLGNFTFRRLTIGKEIEAINRRLAELDLEAGAAKQQEEAIKAAEAAKDATQSANTDKDGTEYVPCTTEDCKAAEASGAVQ